MQIKLIVVVVVVVVGRSSFKSSGTPKVSSTERSSLRSSDRAKVPPGRSSGTPKVTDLFASLVDLL